MTRVLGDDWALPALDTLSRPFFTSEQLTLQRCERCGHVQHPPEEVCQACTGFDLGSFQSAGIGKIESVSIAHHAVHPALQQHVPYAIVLVSVDDAPGVLIVGNVVGTAPDGVKIGDRARVTFEQVTDPQSGVRLMIPQWQVTGR